MKPFKRKVKANALQFSMLISVVVLLLISSALLLYQHQKGNKERISLYHKQVRTVNHLMSANYTYQDLQLPYYSKETTVQFKNYWGGYRLIMAGYETGKFSIIKHGLFGGNMEENQNLTLYLEDNGMPMVIAGNSYLKGRVNLPSGYTKQGSINGHYFQGVLQPNPMNSSRSLPKLDPKWLDYIDFTLNSDYLISPYTPNKDSLIKSFKGSSPNLVAYREFSNQNNHSLFGNQILFDSEHITIEDSMQLDNIVIVSPSVRISEGFSGSIHIIANKIKVERNVDLLFPSSLISQNSQHQVNAENGISIDSDSRIEGNMIYINKKENVEITSHIDISSGVNIKGNIYCQGYLNFQGNIEGAIFSKYLLSENQGGKYLNHLFNGRIESLKSSENYVGLPLLETDYTLAAWVF